MPGVQRTPLANNLMAENSTRGIGIMILIILIVLSYVHYKYPFETKVEIIDKVLDAMDAFWERLFGAGSEVQPPPIIPPTIIANFSINLEANY